MKNSFNRRKIFGRALTLALLFMAAAPALAQSGGAGALAGANTSIRSYWEPIKLIIQAIGAVVGLIGGVRIYNKWTNGDQDINKEIVGWAGACLFLVIVPQFVGAFFGM
ncbi:DUF4134 domain-containing protein [Chryseobacterium taklimakanense]|uniref:DUF4134 domain-containing protein n=1 Tax=Chryseobacterium taklimakanense TaxID=536441 RepID=UPI0023F7CC0A|nr:DUF4134 domain-containing protein [Chryseobacterium taklimakanense]